MIILSDDERVGLDEARPFITQEIFDKGMRFTRALTPTSVCRPSRSSLLTGNYSHTTGVYGNTFPGGGFASFDDTSTIATWLKDEGYATGLFGKYLNEYGKVDPPLYVPPGWDAWRAFYGGARYYDYTWIDESGDLHAGDQYSTYWVGGEAADFINSTLRRPRCSCTWRPTLRTRMPPRLPVTSVPSPGPIRGARSDTTRGTYRTSPSTSGAYPGCHPPNAPPWMRSRSPNGSHSSPSMTPRETSSRR